MVIKRRTAEFRKSGAVSPGPAHITGGTEGAKTAYHVAIKLGSVSHPGSANFEGRKVVEAS